jgi:hypothetical protein
MSMTRWASIVCALAAMPILSPAASAQQAPAAPAQQTAAASAQPAPDASTQQAPAASAPQAPAASSQASAPTPVAGKAPAALSAEGAWPAVLTRSVPRAPAAQPAAWSASDIAEGRARCAALLKGLDLVAEPVAPIREGGACGTPAPMQLVSIGSRPKITFSPPATLTCDMIAALHKWLQKDVQRLARAHLGAPVVEIANMSSFSCRNAYGRARSRLSEHGRVNAIDIGAFVTERGAKTMVVADWGPLGSEIAGAQAEAVKRQAEAAAAARNAKSPAEAPQVATTPETVRSYQAGASLPIGMPRITFGMRAPDAADDLSAGLGWAPPSRLGGPKPANAAPSGVAAGKAAFLHGVHKAACGIFSTVLGPEANKAHKDHFHLDMAERKRTSKRSSICE